VHQAYPYEQNADYLPLSPLEDDQLNIILKDRLGITYPDPNVSVMSEPERLRWYGQDGALDTYRHLLDSSYGVHSKKMDEQKALLKAQQVIEKKGKKKSSTINTPAEDEAITRHDLDQSSTSIPPPSNQMVLVQKRPRTASSELTRGSPQHKRGKKSTPPQLDQDFENATPLAGPSREGGKKVILSPSDDEDEMDIDGDVECLSPEP
jgi:hypothetical protein